jgi:branched-chain amino acid transport system permease protein
MADAPASSLPFGDQKLLALARLLATEADVLLLDEPASGIDIDGVERMLGLIQQLRERGKCVCIVEHNLHVVERLADRVYFMEAGRITAEGTMGELMKQERLSEVYFGSA